MMKKMHRFSCILLALLYLSLWSYPAQAETQVEKEELQTPPAQKVIPIGSLMVLSSYSKILGGSNLSGVYASGNFAPVVKLSPENYLIPLYTGLYRKSRQIINEEEGGRLYTTMMSHNFSVMHKHLYSDLLTQRVTGLVSLNYNKETSDESFGDGLYDYRDYGVNFDYQYQAIKTNTRTDTLLLGGKYCFRKYPNFSSLLTLSGRTGIEDDEKDQNIWGLVSRYTHKFSDKFIFLLSYDYLYKRFVDKLTVDENGYLEDTKRQDNVHLFHIDGNYRPNQSFVYGLATEIELNNSNQNNYDSNNTAGNFADDTFVPHYYNYNRYQIKPSLTYLFPLTEEKNLICKLAYAYTKRDYPNRSIQDAQGTYQEETQTDKIHNLFVNFDYPLSAKFSFLISADYAHTISNMGYEAFYRYDYDTFNILSGLSYKF